MALPHDPKSLAARLALLLKRKPKKGYRLGTPVSARALETFERAHAIALPGDYRDFLLAAGEGASGPNYGLLTLGAAMDERGDGIYSLADPFPAPASTRDHLDFGVGGILPISYDGCSYFHGLVVSGAERGNVWTYVEARPGWIPAWNGKLRDANGARFEREHEPEDDDEDDYAVMYDVALAPQNFRLRLSFARWYDAWLKGAEK